MIKLRILKFTSCIRLINRSLTVGLLISLVYPSMMMTTEEVSILNSIAPSAESLLDEADEVDDISLATSLVPDIFFLSAILYFQPTHWTVWINDKIYTDDNDEDEFLKLTKVTQHIVELELKDCKKPTKIRANQSLVTSGKRIVDGDARVKIKPAQL
ncbi:MAG: hypothetical protein NT128_02635 [Proteobacteria bacterium]|nr:hypothetical protein [Pseudomonadota bacterium]